MSFPWLSCDLVQTHGSPGGSPGCLQIPDSDQVVHRDREREHPRDSLMPTMTQLPESADGLQPPEDLFNAFPFLLTEGVAGVVGGAAVNRAAAIRVVLRHVRCHLQLTQLGDEVLRIVM